MTRFWISPGTISGIWFGFGGLPACWFTLFIGNSVGWMIWGLKNSLSSKKFFLKNFSILNIYLNKILTYRRLDSSGLFRFARHIEREKNLSTTKIARIVIEAMVIPYCPRRTKLATPGIETSTAWSASVLVSFFSELSSFILRLSCSRFFDFPYSPSRSLFPRFDLGSS